MTAFTDLHDAAQDFSEGLMGETFSYTSLAGTVTTGLLGVFNQAQAEFSFEDFSQKRTVDLICVSSKTQWKTVVPANRATVTYGGIGYLIASVDGDNTAGEIAYTLGLKRMT